MNKCSICLEHKSKLLNKKFKCTCSIFVCNNCSDKLKELDSIYAKCPQCRNEESTIKENNLIIKMQNKYINIKNTFNSIINSIIKSDILYLIKNIIITFLIWFSFFSILGHYTINNYINRDYIIINTDKINNITLVLLIQPLIGFAMFLIFLVYLLFCYFIICIL